MYKVKVKSNNGTTMPPALIKKQLQQIVDMAGGIVILIVINSY